VIGSEVRTALLVPGGNEEKRAVWRPKVMLTLVQVCAKLLNDSLGVGRHPFHSTGFQVARVELFSDMLANRHAICREQQRKPDCSLRSERGGWRILGWMACTSRMISQQSRWKHCVSAGHDVAALHVLRCHQNRSVDVV
jgi:hypothetical protein